MLTVRGLPLTLLASLTQTAAENERSLEAELRYALKRHARDGWRIHGSELPGPSSGPGGVSRPITVRKLDCKVVETLKQFADLNHCRLWDEVLHALARYVHGARLQLDRPALSADDLTARALVAATNHRQANEVRPVFGLDQEEVR